VLTVRCNLRFNYFTARRYASAVSATCSGLVSVCLSTCLSVTSWCSVKMPKQMTTKTTSCDSPWIPVF